MPNTQKIGRLGEDIAVRYLKGRGYRILERNYFLRARHGPKIAEIDIIAKKGGCFVFVEVKTIKANENFMAQDKVNEVKKWKIAKAAEMWLIQKRVPLNVKWQIDVIAVELLEGRSKALSWFLGPKTKISHFENIQIC